MLAEPVAGALDLDDDGMVQQAIEQGRGDNRAAEDVAPFGEAAVRGQDHGAPLIPGVHELKDQIAAAGDDGQVADLVDDQQLRPAQEAQAFAQGAFALGLGQRADDVGQGGEVDRTAGLDSLDPKSQRQVGFAAAGLPNEVDDLMAVDELELGQGEDTVAVERGLEREVKAAQGLDRSGS